MQLDGLKTCYSWTNFINQLKQRSAYIWVCKVSERKRFSDFVVCSKIRKISVCKEVFLRYNAELVSSI